MRSRSHKIQVNPWNPAEFTKTRKIPQNSVKIVSNTCLYNTFETYLSYWGYFNTWRKLANLSWTFVTETCKQGPKTTRCRLCCKNQTQPDSREMGRFFCEFVPKNPAKFAFFSATYQKPWFKLREFNKRSKDVFSLVVKLLLIPITLSIDVVFTMLRENPCTLQT